MKINKEKHTLLPLEKLKTFVEYNPETGEMWRISKMDRWGNLKGIRKLITGKNNRGYYWVSFVINGVRNTYLVHRLAFLWMTGKHPDGEIDHIDGVRSNNNWLNLRECSPLDNSRNQGIRKDNTSGVRGVNYNSRATDGRKKWIARISHQGKRLLIGNYRTFEEAVAARQQAEINLGYHENHGKREAWCE